MDVLTSWFVLFKISAVNFCTLSDLSNFFVTENGEATQVLKYGRGQHYEGHYDYFFDPVNQQQGGHRYATVLMYLADVEEGGETVFPNAKVRFLFSSLKIQDLASNSPVCLYFVFFSPVQLRRDQNGVSVGRVDLELSLKREMPSFSSA